MIEVFFIAVMLVLMGVVVCVGAVMGLLAMVKIGAVRQEVARLRDEVRKLRPEERVVVEPAKAPVVVAPVPAAPVAPPVWRPEPVVAAKTGRETAEGLEAKIGRQWIAWVGAVVVFLGAVFFLKLAFENDWIGPTGQVAICALAAVAMVGVGSHFIARRWRMLGQSVIGLGLAILYATFYSAFAVYAPPVMSQRTAFGLMVAVTIGGMTLAVVHDAISMAFLAVLGGILTPVLVSTGQDSRDTLFTYLLLLDLGVLAVAFFRGWRLLDTLAMVGTFFMYGGWYAKFYRPEVMGPSLAWLGVFYVMFLVLPFAYHFVRKQEVTVERFIMALGNAFFALAYAWMTLRQNHLFAMGFVSLGMAGAYVTLGAMVRRRLPGDAKALFGLIAMAVMFLTLAAPMQLQAHGILLAWAAEAPVLVYLGYRFGYRPVRVLGAAVLVVAVGRLFFSHVHWPLHQGLFVPFWNRQFLSATAVPLAMGVYALVHGFHSRQGTLLDRGLQVAAGVGAGLLGLVIVHAEVGGWLRNEMSAYAAMAAVTALWVLGAGIYLWAGSKAREAMLWVWGGGTLALLVAVNLCMLSYAEETSDRLALFANARFGAGLLLAAVVFGYAWVVMRSRLSRENAKMLGVAYLACGIVGLLALLSTEVYTYCMAAIAELMRARRAGQMSITLVWSVYAAVLLLVGFWRLSRALRLTGLALFGIAAIKLVLMDLTYLKDVYRIVAFLVLGLLMLTASYVYHRLEKRLAGGANGGGNREMATGGTR